MLIFAAIFAIFVYGMTAAMLGTILPDLSERFRLTPAQNGAIAFAQALGLMLASLGVGPLLDTEGDKVGLVMGLAFIVVALLALPRSRGFRSVAVLLFVLGVGGGIVVTGANALVSGVTPEHRATALNLVNLFFGLGGLATPFIAANLFKSNDRRVSDVGGVSGTGGVGSSPPPIGWVRLCLAVAALAAAALVVQVVAHMPAAPGASGFVLAKAAPVLGRPLLFLLGLFLFLYVSCEVGVWNWLPRHLIAQGVPESRALNILSLGFGLGLLIGRLAAGSVLLRAPAIEVTLAASIAMAVTTFLMLRTNRAGAAWVLVFLAGLSMAPVFPTALALTGAAFPHMTGTAIGFVVTCGWAGLAVSSKVIGVIAGGDPRRLKTALLLIPASAVLMAGLNLAMWSRIK